jgi:hypothetical protein
MSELIRREIPLTVGSIILLLLFFDYYIEFASIRALTLMIQDWAVILVAIASGIGIINVFQRTYHSTIKRRPYWYLDVWMVLLMVVMGIFGLQGVKGQHPAYVYMMSTLFAPVRATIYGMIVFDITSAFYRSFRVRTYEAAVMFIMAFVIMMRNAPISGALAPWAVTLGNWFNDVPSMATSRSILIVAGLGMIAFTIKALLWHEKPTVGVIE